jgi:cytochrome c-type biogenesis protein
MAAGGAVLIAMGVLIWTGELFQLNVEAQRFLDRFGLNFSRTSKGLARARRAAAG